MASSLETNDSTSNQFCNRIGLYSARPIYTSNVTTLSVRVCKIWSPNDTPQPMSGDSTARGNRYPRMCNDRARHLYTFPGGLLQVFPLTARAAVSSIGRSTLKIPKLLRTRCRSSPLHSAGWETPLCTMQRHKRVDTNYHLSEWSKTLFLSRPFNQSWTYWNRVW